MSKVEVRRDFDLPCVQRSVSARYGRVESHSQHLLWSDSAKRKFTSGDGVSVRKAQKQTQKDLLLVFNSFWVHPPRLWRILADLRQQMQDLVSGFQLLRPNLVRAVVPKRGKQYEQAEACQRVMSTRNGRR
jgi:hypothetical protein